MRTGTAHLPLHGGRAPRWLFTRMVELSREIVRVVAEDFGPTEILHRLSDPFWFQAFGCVLGFDWHSSGVTTTVCGAVKEGIHDLQGQLGVFAAGGKEAGKSSASENEPTRAAFRTAHQERQPRWLEGTDMQREMTDRRQRGQFSWIGSVEHPGRRQGSTSTARRPLFQRPPQLDARRAHAADQVWRQCRIAGAT